MSDTKRNVHIAPANIKVGAMIAFGGVAMEIVEVNEVKHPFGSSTFNVAYRVHDNRQAPPFVSPTAHLFVSKHTNLRQEFAKVVAHYEKIKSQLRSAIK